MIGEQTATNNEELPRLKIMNTVSRYPTRLLVFTLYATVCAKSHDKIKYCFLTFKIELRRNFPFIYFFFVPRTIRLFHKIRNNFKFIKAMAKTLGNIFLK